MADWADNAACLGVHPPTLFFSLAPEDESAALAICSSCPVREPCLRFALEHGERFGVWGGTTERQRRRLLRSATTAPVVSQAS